MKINDLLNESQKLDELEMPNFATKQGRSINRAEKAGAADVKQSVKDLSVEFATRLGTQGKKFNTATTDDVIEFLKSKNVDTSKIDTTSPMDKNRIGLVFTTLVKDKIMGKSIAAQEPGPSKGKFTKPVAKANPGKTPGSNVMTIQQAIAKLNPKQQASIRQLAAKQAGVV